VIDDPLPTRAAQGARGLVLTLLALLLGIFIVWHLKRFSLATAAIACTLAVVPWLPLIRGLISGRRGSCLGGLLLTTPYLGYGLMEVVANAGARRYAAALVFVGFALGVALVGLMRLSRPRAEAPSSQTAR
jgi:hypothetical protein